MSTIQLPSGAHEMPISSTMLDRPCRFNTKVRARVAALTNGDPGQEQWATDVLVMSTTRRPAGLALPRRTYPRWRVHQTILQYLQVKQLYSNRNQLSISRSSRPRCWSDFG